MTDTLEFVTIDGADWAVKHSKKGFTIVMCDMYQSPDGVSDGGISFPLLKAISDHFGTEWIDVDGVSERGCETCDWGSRYGVEIEIRGATKNIDSPATSLTTPGKVTR